MRLNRNVMIVAALMILFTACSKKDIEEVTATYPGGEKKETAFFQGKGTEKARQKSFEYYKTGELKKVFNYKDNLFHGPWTYWYKNGKKMGEGLIENKAINLGLSSGTEIYYWPNGATMLRSETVRGKLKTGTTAVYYDEQGKEYNDESRPDALVKKTREIVDSWERGEI